MVRLSPEWTSTTWPVNYLLFETEDLVIFCYFQRPFPYSRADWATFFNSMNYLVEIPSIASFDNLAKPFSSKTFLTSTPSLETRKPSKVYFDKFEKLTVTSLWRKDDYKTDRIALALFFDSPSKYLIQIYLVASQSGRLFEFMSSLV